MKKMLAAYCAGLVFGIGLVLAQMTNPAKVIGFLNVAGDWDPSLLLVMASGLVVFGAAFALSKSQTSPYLAPAFVLPREQALTRPLILGAVVFGAGWGWAGLCPGPAVVSAAFGEPRAWVFLLAMLAGMHLHHALNRTPAGGENPVAAAD